jgi:hypothetical protein
MPSEFDRPDDARPQASEPAGAWSWWRRVREVGDDRDDGIRGRSARQYIGSLRATYAALCAKGESYPKNLTDGIEAILAKYARPDARWTTAATWDDAYQLERLIINILDAERLDVELDAKIQEAKDNSMTTAAAYYDAQRKAQTEPNLAQDRAMLERLTQDMQWFYNTRDQRRRYAKQAQTRATATFLGALVLFCGMLFTLSYYPGEAVKRQATLDQDAVDGKGALARLEAEKRAAVALVQRVKEEVK